MQAGHFALHAELEDRHWWFLARRHLITSVVRRSVPSGVGNVVVDVGCGTGANLAALASDYRCFGVDPSAEAVAAAAARFPGLSVLQGDAPADVSVQLAGASLVMLADVLEHVDDDAALLGSIVDALPHDARVLVTVPAGPHLWTGHDRAFGHRRRYTFETLAALWADLPVQVQLLTAFNARLYLPIRAVRGISAWRGRAFGRQGTDFDLPPAWLNGLLTRIMRGESRRIVRALCTGRPAYGRGVSLLALLEKAR